MLEKVLDEGVYKVIRSVPLEFGKEVGAGLIGSLFEEGSSEAVRVGKMGTLDQSQNLKCGGMKGR